MRLSDQQSTMVRTLRVIAIILAAIVALAACSSNETTVTASEGGESEAAADTTSDPGQGADADEDADAGATDDAASSDEDASSDETAMSSDEADPADDETDAAADEDDGDDPSFSGSGSGNFCEIARQLDEDAPFDDPDLSPFSEEFFVAVDEFYDGVVAIAPDEIRPDLEIIQTGLEQLMGTAAKYDFNFFDPEFGAEMEQLDLSAMDEASLRLEAYMSDVCGIDISGGDSIDDPADDAEAPDLGDTLGEEQMANLNQIIVDELGISPELAECLLEELPDLSSAMADMELFTQPICGTSLFEIATNAGG